MRPAKFFREVCINCGAEIQLEPYCKDCWSAENEEGYYDMEYPLLDPEIDDDHTS